MAPSTPSLLSAAETRELLPMGELIEAVGRAFDARSSAPQRLVLADEGQDWIVMPALVPGGGMLCKLLRVGHTASAGQPTIAGVVTPYLLARAFGLPVLWRYLGASTVGNDAYHYQLGLGAVVRLHAFDVEVEGVPLGERAIVVGAGYAF